MCAVGWSGELGQLSGASWGYGSGPVGVKAWSGAASSCRALRLVSSRVVKLRFATHALIDGDWKTSSTATPAAVIYA